MSRVQSFRDACFNSPSESVVEETVPSEKAVAEGDIVESPLVGVAYLAASPDKPPFVAVGDTVKKDKPL